MGKQHEKKNTRHRKSVWWEDREKGARKGQIRGKSKNNKQMNPAGVEMMCTDSPGTEEV